jgi:GntR family transcriptional regulator, transcriptional repressor for pyruvate dehydrogenase complex
VKDSLNKKSSFPTLSHLKAVQKTKLYQQIAAQIQDLIENGKLKEGDQLPPERELAEIFQVSRHPVREAIRTLEQKNILHSRVGSGTYVILGNERSVINFLAQAIHKEKGKLADIFQFRRMIEPQIARMAAENASREDIEAIARIVHDQRHATEDLEKFITLDQAFHLALAKATGNDILFSIVERINDILSVSRAKYSQSPTRIEHSLKGHESILETVSMGNPELASQAMYQHIEQVENAVLGKKQ